MTLTHSHLHLASNSNIPQAVTSTTITSSARLPAPAPDRPVLKSRQCLTGYGRELAVELRQHAVAILPAELVSQLCGCPSNAPSGKIK